MRELQGAIDSFGSSKTNALTWATLFENCTHVQDRAIVYERLSFNAPLRIFFFSDTTGKSKAITYRSGSISLQLAKEHLL